MPSIACMGVAGVERVLFKELFPGDYAKFQAASNASPTGGGARDLRYSGFQQLQPVIVDMFPTVVNVPRKRNAVSYVDVRQGVLRWSGGAMDVQFEPAQDERDNEWRLAQVSGMPPFTSKTLPTNYNAGNREMLLLLQDVNHDVWPVIDVRSNVVSDAAVGAFVQQKFASHTNSSHAVVGYMDFVKGTSW